MTFHHPRRHSVLLWRRVLMSPGAELRWCRVYFHKLCLWMSWEGADGEDRLKATLTRPAELQCQEMVGAGLRALMVVGCAKHVF